MDFVLAVAGVAVVCATFVALAFKEPILEALKSQKNMEIVDGAIYATIKTGRELMRIYAEKGTVTDQDIASVVVRIVDECEEGDV